MKKYQKPNLQIELFITEDILTESGDVTNTPKKLRQSAQHAGSVSFTTLQTLEG